MKLKLATSDASSHYVEPDLETAQQFLDMLGQHEEFTFQTFDDSKSKNSKRSRVFHGTLAQHHEALTELNQQGAGVFVMVNRGNGVTPSNARTCRTNNNVERVRSVFVDLDSDSAEALDDVMASEAKPNIVVESSTGKYHCYWTVEDCSLDMFSKVQAALAERYGSDPAVKDLARVMRLPGFFHQKQTPMMTKLHKQLCHRQTGLSLTQLLEANNITVNSSKVRPRLVLVSNSIPEGSRNATLTSKAGSMRAKGLLESEILQNLFELNKTHCVQPLDESEIRTIAASVCRYRPNVANSVLAETLTDTGNAERFAKRYSSSVKYVPDWGKFIIFNGHYWQIDSANRVMQLAKVVARDIYLEGSGVDDEKLRHEIARHSLKTQSLPRLLAMIELSKSIETMQVSSDQLNTDDMLLCVKNGIVDLRTGSLRDGKSTDYITQIAPVQFDPDATCPRFLQFLDETFIGETSWSLIDQICKSQRQELIDYIQKALGYCLTGRTGEQSMFFAYGTGANGKTTLINLMLSLMGNDYSLQTPMETLMVKSGGNSSSNHLARLQNIRFVASTEVEDGAKMSESLIKQMTGGDRIAARFLYKEYIEFTPKFKLFIAGNHKPIIKGSDYGIWRRIVGAD
jgi:P4 family phage/plasmid primase-like protien